MRRPLWQSHIVAAALSVGCGAAPPAGATQTAAVSTEHASEPESADAPAPAEDEAIERTESAAEGGSDEQEECAGDDCASPGARGQGRERRARRERRRVAKSSGEREGGRDNEPAAEQSPEPAAPVAPPVRGELVDRLFFPRGSARLDEHAHALDAIAKVVRAGEPVTIIVIGGADEREPTGLARERAHAVRDALLARGVPASWIVIGLSQPSSGPPSYDQKVEIRLQRP